MNRNEISLKKKINFTADSLRKRSFITKREINYFVFTEKKYFYCFKNYTFCDKDIDGCRLGIRGAARIIACVRFHRMVNRQSTLSRAGIGLYGYGAAPRSIVIYHSIIVIPENILRRCWTLKWRK